MRSICRISLCTTCKFTRTRALLVLASSTEDMTGLLQAHIADAGSVAHAAP